MAFFMVQNDLTEEDVLTKGMNIDFPDSVIELFEGYLGQPHGGFPEELQRVILKKREPITVRPGELLENVNFRTTKRRNQSTSKTHITSHDLLLMHFIQKYLKNMSTTINEFGDVSVLDTPTFLYGMRLGEEIELEIEKGKTLIIKLVSIGQPQADGHENCLL